MNPCVVPSALARLIVSFVLFLLVIVPSSMVGAAGQDLPASEPSREKPILASTLILLLVDHITNEPIEGAEALILLGSSALSFDAVPGGAFVFPALPGGTYIVAFAAEGYENTSTEVVVPPGGFITQVRIDVPMPRKSAGAGPQMSVFLSVFDGITNNPIGGVQFSAVPAAAGAPTNLEGGLFTYPALDVQPYDITVSAAGYDDELVRVRDPRPLVSVLVRMTPEVRVIRMDCNGGGGKVFEGIEKSLGDVFLLGLSGVFLVIAGHPGVVGWIKVQ